MIGKEIIDLDFKSKTHTPWEHQKRAWEFLKSRPVAGAEHKKIRVGGEVTPVWFIPDQPQLEQEITVPEPVEDDSF